MAAPSMTINAAGNVLASASIAASGTTTANVDVSSKFEVQIQVQTTFGTVAATSGIQIDVFRRIGTGPVVDTVPIQTMTITSTASTTKDLSLALPTGKYQVKLTNLDATNGVTATSITGDTVDGVS
jgi:hypothetical protein